MGDLASAPRSPFPRYWTAAAITSFGSAVTVVALPVLVVQELGATPFEVGVVNAAQFVPYAIIASLRVAEPRRHSSERHLLAEIRDGLRWTYRHRTLGPLALSTHIWFLANSAAMTVLSLLVLRTLGFTAASFGMLLTVFGFASLIGASIAARSGARLGPGLQGLAAGLGLPIRNGP